jgi:hypothetical protein
MAGAAQLPGGVAAVIARRRSPYAPRMKANVADLGRRWPRLRVTPGIAAGAPTTKFASFPELLALSGELDNH